MAVGRRLIVVIVAFPLPGALFTLNGYAPSQGRSAGRTPTRLRKGRVADVNL